MKIKPLADRVLVLPAPAEEKVGGIRRMPAVNMKVGVKRLQ